MSTAVVSILVGVNLLLLFLIFSAPVGLRTVKLERRIRAAPEKLWQALWPLGPEVGWSGEVIGAEALADDRARVTLSWEGRDGRPIERIMHLESVRHGARFTARVVDDSSLDPVFWQHYREDVSIVPDGDGACVRIERTDRYRGAAFLVFRYFALRRELARLTAWAETGAASSQGLFERPLTQFGFAALSALILWPLFGLDRGGFVLAVVLTAVVALHELGHLAAFRISGHRRVRMIFLPLLGGIAIGGRPYDSHFEVGFVALMGAGFSAFLVPVAIAASLWAETAGMPGAGVVLATLAGFLALFNLGNLVPVWKFDGGQILRQLFPNPVVLAAATFAMLSALLYLGYLAGFSPGALMVSGAVFAILSVMTAGSGVKPRHALRAMRPAERLALVAATLAVFIVHADGLLWAAARVI